MNQKEDWRDFPLDCILDAMQSGHSFLPPLLLALHLGNCCPESNSAHFASPPGRHCPKLRKSDETIESGWSLWKPCCNPNELQSGWAYSGKQHPLCCLFGCSVSSECSVRATLKISECLMLTLLVNDHPMQRLELPSVDWTQWRAPEALIPVHGRHSFGSAWSCCYPAPTFWCASQQRRADQSFRDDIIVCKQRESSVCTSMILAFSSTNSRTSIFNFFKLSTTNGPFGPLHLMMAPSTYSSQLQAVWLRIKLGQNAEANAKLASRRNTTWLNENNSLCRIIFFNFLLVFVKFSNST